MEEWEIKITDCTARVEKMFAQMSSEDFHTKTPVYEINRMLNELQENKEIIEQIMTEKREEVEKMFVEDGGGADNNKALQLENQITEMDNILNEITFYSDVAKNYINAAKENEQKEDDYHQDDKGTADSLDDLPEFFSDMTDMKEDKEEQIIEEIEELQDIEENEEQKQPEIVEEIEEPVEVDISEELQEIEEIEMAEEPVQEEIAEKPVTEIRETVLELPETASEDYIQICEPIVENRTINQLGDSMRAKELVIDKCIKALQVKEDKEEELEKQEQTQDIEVTKEEVKEENEREEMER